MRVRTKLRFIVGGWWTVASLESAEAGNDLDPTREDLKAFSIVYDGTTRPDLITRWMKLMAVTSDAESLDNLNKVLAPADLKQLASFQQDLVKEDADGNKVFAAMFEQLCRDIHTLDGQAVAKRVSTIDETVAARRESLAEALLNGLSADGAMKVMREAARPATRIKGSITDVPAIAERYPDYVKKQYTERCISFGYISKD